MTKEIKDLTNQGVVFEVAGEEVKLTFGTVKNHLTKGNDEITDQEAMLFMNLCKYQKLNPFLNEAYIVKFKGSPAQNIVGKEAYMKKAENHPKYDGMRAGLILSRDGKIIEVEGSFSLTGDTVLGGWAEIYRKDRSYPYVAKVGLDEYDKGQSTWNKMKKTMIRKVAIVQGLREAFPTELGALYTEEEVNTVTPEQELKDEVSLKANKKSMSFKEEDIQDVEYQELKGDSRPKTEPKQQSFVSEETGPGF